MGEYAMYVPSNCESSFMAIDRKKNFFQYFAFQNMYVSH